MTSIALPGASTRTTARTGAGTAAAAIAGWLLTSGVQLPRGRERGGVAGWLDPVGRPEFVYPEITGYFLVTMRWLAACPPAPSVQAAAHAAGEAALTWLDTLLGAPGPVPTRRFLDPAATDWRNGAEFTFDLAMAARGAASAATSGHEHGRRVAAAASARIPPPAPDGLLTSHRAVGGPRVGAGARLPLRWSTRRGPHHLKAAAALLALPESTVAPGLRSAAAVTAAHGESEVGRGASHPLSHPALYALEGLVLRAAHEGAGLDAAATGFRVLLDRQRPDGAVPEVDGGAVVRSDVLAQALRIGLILRAHGRLDPADHWRLDRLADALLGHVQPDGAVLFAHDRPAHNAWCAMFAHQALALYASTEDSVVEAATEYLV